MRYSLLLFVTFELSLLLIGCGGMPPTVKASPQSGAPQDTPAPASSGSADAGGTPLFTKDGAAWLYTAPSGKALNISSIGRNLGFVLNTHDKGYDYPVQYTDGSHGCTTFTDTLVYSYNHDKVCVPNPADGFHPSTGGWGFNDGHLGVVDTATRKYYDFWKLSVDGHGQPTSTNVGKIVSGSLDGNGSPGTTAANITALAGDILPGELDCATCLNHALNVIVPGTMNSAKLGTQGPVPRSDGSVPGGIFREGAKIRFDPSIDVSTLDASTASKAILRALQLYGGLITDQTGGKQVAFYTDLPKAPDLSGINVLGQHLWLYY